MFNVKIVKVNLIIYAILVMLSFSGFSKDLELTNNNQKIEIINNAKIDVSTGNIKVETLFPANLLRADKKPLVAFYPDKYSISSLPASVKVKWVVYNADSCTSAVNGGSNWNNFSPSHEFNLEMLHEENVTITQDNTELFLNCSNSHGTTSSEPIVISQAKDGSAPPSTSTVVIKSFGLKNISGSEVPETGNYELQWIAEGTPNPSCDVYDGLTKLNINSLNNNDSLLVNISSQTTYQLRCSNGSTQDTENLVVTIGQTNNPPVVGCENAIKPPSILSPVNYNWTNPYQGGISITPSSPTYGIGANYSDPIANGRKIIIKINPARKYVVMDGIDIPNKTGNFYNKIVQEPSPGTARPNAATYSISQCEGDFNPATAACVGPFLNQIYVTTNPNSTYLNGLSGCLVEKGKNYYLNLVYAPSYNNNNEPFDASNLCDSGTECGLFFGPSQSNDY
ncbi:hypothetical protein [Marinicella gelatinilytica]|uniref:hypothetical protein n=1 Tax=Marinicella gelatinilytica TaxID=2996017 RepID=UPI00226084DF|nr:hypothetical protein [Marinicella gelatinilytica]MCX7544075.1 hypothetical protein [Marinicella gelatinilytica]